MSSIPPIPPADNKVIIGSNPLAKELSKSSHMETQFLGLNKKQWRVSIASCISATMSYGYVRGASNLFEPMLEYYNSNKGNATETRSTLSDFAATNAWILLGISLGATTCGYILPKIGNKKATIFRMKKLCFYLKRGQIDNSV